MAHLTNFSFELFYKIFTEDASLPLLYYGAKKSKMTKNSNQGGGGSCLSYTPIDAHTHLPVLYKLRSPSNSTHSTTRSQLTLLFCIPSGARHPGTISPLFTSTLLWNSLPSPIQGKCKALWGKPRTLLRLSQRSTELSCTRDLMQKDRKNQRRLTSNVVVRFFFAWTKPTHQFDCRTSSGCRCLWGTHVGGHARTRYRVGPGLRLPLRKKENGEKRLKQLYSRSELAPSWSVKEKSNSVVCKKKNLSSLSCQLAAEEAYTTMSCNNSVILSNRLSRWASKSENERTCFDSGWPWGKRKSRLDLMAFFRSPIVFCTVVQCWQ